MTKYEELKKVICEALPRLMEIKEGYQFYYIPNKEINLKWEAKVLIVYSGGQIADTGDYDEVYVDFHSYYNGFERLPIEEIENFELLGIDPNLSDVLEWLKGFKTEMLSINKYGYFHDVNLKTYPKIFWDLSKPLLKDQSEELIDYLLTIKK